MLSQSNSVDYALPESIKSSGGIFLATSGAFLHISLLKLTQWVLSSFEYGFGLTKKESVSYKTIILLQEPEKGVKHQKGAPGAGVGWRVCCLNLGL